MRIEIVSVTLEKTGSIYQLLYNLSFKSMNGITEVPKTSKSPELQRLHLLNTMSLVWFYEISTIVGYLMPNPFYTYKQFYFAQFSLT